MKNSASAPKYAVSPRPVFFRYSSAFLAIQPHRDRRDETAGFDAPASLALAGLTIVGLLIFHIHNIAADIYWVAAIVVVVAALVLAGVLAAPVAVAAGLAGVVVLAASAYWPVVDSARSIDQVRILLDWAWPAPVWFSVKRPGEDRATGTVNTAETWPWYVTVTCAAG